MVELYASRGDAGNGCTERRGVASCAGFIAKYWFERLACVHVMGALITLAPGQCFLGLAGRSCGRRS